MAIQFFTEGVSFKLPNPRETASWVRTSIRKEKRVSGQLTFVFCSDAYLLGLNTQYLHHKTLTDILTFDLSELEKEISGEIYISVQRVEENAVKFKKTFEDELHRVMIHGVLHLVGYNDKTAAEKVKMREKEEAYLSLR